MLLGGATVSEFVATDKPEFVCTSVVSEEHVDEAPENHFIVNDGVPPVQLAVSITLPPGDITGALGDSVGVPSGLGAMVVVVNVDVEEEAVEETVVIVVEETVVTLVLVNVIVVLVTPLILFTLPVRVPTLSTSPETVPDEYSMNKLPVYDFPRMWGAELHWKVTFCDCPAEMFIGACWINSEGSGVCAVLFAHAVAVTVVACDTPICATAVPLV